MSIKYSVYLREELYSFVQILCEQSNASLSEKISKLVGEHREISQSSPDVLQGVRVYARHNDTRNYKAQAYGKKIQFSLASEDSHYLKKFAAEFSDKNISVATNLIVAECQAMGEFLLDILEALG